MFRKLMPIIFIILIILQIWSTFVLTTPVMAILGCLAILVASIHWELKGGLLAAILCSGLILEGYFAAKLFNGNLLIIAITIVLYFAMGVGIGAVIGTIRKQKADLIRGEDRYKALIVDLANEKERLKVTLGSIGDGVIATDKEGKIVIINKVACLLTDWHDEDALGKSFCDVFKIVNGDSKESCSHLFKEVLQNGQEIELPSNTILISKNGTERIIADSISPIKDSSANIVGMITVFRDNTEHIHDEERIRYLSYHDRLTGLYNRSFYDEELKRVDTTRQLPISFIIGDVNGLKMTNDAFGHSEGDRLLQTIARIMIESTRSEDIVCRWGGDEFSIILPQTNEVTAGKIISRINEKCSSEAKGIIPPRISLGCSTKVNPSQKTSDLIKEAEDRMYYNKMTEKRNIQGIIIESLEKQYLMRSYEMGEHQSRVQELIQQLKKNLSLTDSEVEYLNLLSSYHDIGQITMSEFVLGRPGPLSPDEWKEIKKHPETGYHIAISSAELSPVADYILTHHERWDGQGYPHKLKGSDIPKLSRIFFIVDSYVVMTNPRPYKPKLNREQAIAEIRSCAGKQFDPEFTGIIVSFLVKQDQIS